MRGDKAAGWALIGAAAATVLAMAHHPASAHAAAGPLVHAAMILLLAILSFGFLAMSRSRGLEHPAVLAGLVAWGFGTIGHVAAATINGFVVPALAARGQFGADLVAFSWAANQAFAALGVWGTGVAYLLWGVERLRGAAWLGAGGIVAGVAPPAMLALGILSMDLHGAFIVYAVEMGWAALVGIELLRSAGVPAEA